MSHTQTVRGRLSERFEYRVYFILMYPFALAGSAASRLFARALTRSYTDDRKRNAGIFNETSAALNSVLPWIYMGR